MIYYMDFYLVIGVIVIAYLGAAVAVLLNKRKLAEAVTGGTIAWIIVLLTSFILPYDTIMALALAFGLGIIAQIITQLKLEFSEAIEGKK